MTTVRQLIEYLNTLPQDFPVLYARYSDWATLELEQVKVQRSTDSLTQGSAIQHHNLPGEFRTYYGSCEYRGTPLPIPVDAVMFPGN